MAMGVPAHKIVIGHSYGCSDFGYHMTIAGRGCYLGFDRFGLEMLVSDASRIESLLKVWRAGAGNNIVVSHDSVWCFLGNFLPPAMKAELESVQRPLVFVNKIQPRLLAAGMPQTDIDALLTENPRRYFAGEPIPAA